MCSKHHTVTCSYFHGIPDSRGPVISKVSHMSETRSKEYHVVSLSEMAKGFLEHHDLTFSHRPHVAITDQIDDMNNGIFCASKENSCIPATHPMTARCTYCIHSRSYIYTINTWRKILGCADKQSRLLGILGKRRQNGASHVDVDMLGVPLTYQEIKGEDSISRKCLSCYLHIIDEGLTESNSEDYGFNQSHSDLLLKW